MLSRHGAEKGVGRGWGPYKFTGSMALTGYIEVWIIFKEYPNFTVHANLLLSQIHVPNLTECMKSNSIF